MNSVPIGLWHWTKDDKRSLAVSLCHMFVKHHHMKSTEAAELVAGIIGKSDKTVRK